MPLSLAQKGRTVPCDKFAAGAEPKMKRTRHDSLTVTINVRYPEFEDNMAKLYRHPRLREAVQRCRRGYGVNRSTVIQYLVQKEIEVIGRTS